MELGKAILLSGKTKEGALLCGFSNRVHLAGKRDITGKGCWYGAFNMRT